MNYEREITKLEQAVDSLHRRNRRLTRMFYGLLALLAIVIPTALLAQRTSATDPIVNQDSVLRVRGLVVVDPQGKERVRIGAPLPAPLLQGRRYKRDGAISGILLMDAEGTERSGYFTSDTPGTVALTLDTVRGQTAMFLANDDKGANLQVHDTDSRHSVGMYAVGDAPNFVVDRDGKTIFEIPNSGPEKK